MRDGNDKNFEIIRRPAAIILVCLISMAQIALFAFLYRRSDTAFSSEIISNYFLYYQDSFILLVLALTIALITFYPWKERDARGSFELNKKSIITISGGVFLVCYVGTYAVFGNFPLSIDEFMADFDSRILAHGQLFALVAPEWRAYVSALQPNFLLKLPGAAAWSSSYLPGNAAIRAAFSWLGDSALASPSLAAAALLCVFDIGRKIKPEQGDLAFISVLLLATSSQFLVMGMTAYSMTAHLAINLIWLWLVLVDRRWSHFLAVLVSFAACGLHQVPFHPVFVVPFLLWMWREGRPGLALCYCFSLGAAALFWFNYWTIAGAWALPGATGARDLGGGGFADRIIHAVTEMQRAESLVLLFDNLVRLLTWQSPAAILLVTVALMGVRPLPGIARPLVQGPLLMLGLAVIVMPFQGHGWGYRYLHGFLGSFALLGGLGWCALRERLALGGPPSRFNNATLRMTLILSLIVSLGLLLPLRSYQAYAFSKPYRDVDAVLGRLSADIVVVENGARWYAEDLVRNDPYLRTKPLRMRDLDIPPMSAAHLCRNYKVKIITRTSSELHPLRPYTNRALIGFSNAALTRLEKAGCDVPKDRMKQNRIAD